MNQADSVEQSIRYAEAITDVRQRLARAETERDAAKDASVAPQANRCSVDTIRKMYVSTTGVVHVWSGRVRLLSRRYGYAQRVTTCGQLLQPEWTEVTWEPTCKRCAAKP